MNRHHCALKALAIAALLHVGSVSAEVVTFDQANFPSIDDFPNDPVRPSGVPFKAPYTEAGFTVTPKSAVHWYGLGHTYAPWPNSYIYIFRNQYMDSITDGIEITHGGQAFNFSSLLLYSSVMEVPYVFTGRRNGNVVFTATGTVPDPHGEFVSLSNPYASAEIDSLDLTFTNVAKLYPIGGNRVRYEGINNPVGISQISLTSVPEPAQLLLVGVGLVSLLGHRKLAARRSA